MPGTGTTTLIEQGGKVIHQTKAGHLIEIEWVLLSPEKWERTRSEPGWVKYADVGGFVWAERVLTG
jgi:hypothetical protein